MQVFSASIIKLGINACLNVPEKIVKRLLAAAGKKSAPVQVKCVLNGVDFDANVVRYSGDWRLVSESGDTASRRLRYRRQGQNSPRP
jgi:hypothetical protein